jgi:hypothetical protein
MTLLYRQYSTSYHQSLAFTRIYLVSTKTTRRRRKFAAQNFTTPPKSLQVLTFATLIESTPTLVETVPASHTKVPRIQAIHFEVYHLGMNECEDGEDRLTNRYGMMAYLARLFLVNWAISSHIMDDFRAMLIHTTM